MIPRSVIVGYVDLFRYSDAEIEAICQTAEDNPGLMVTFNTFGGRIAGIVVPVTGRVYQTSKDIMNAGWEVEQVDTDPVFLIFQEPRQKKRPVENLPPL